MEQGDRAGAQPDPSLEGEAPGPWRRRHFHEVQDDRPALECRDEHHDRHCPFSRPVGFGQPPTAQRGHHEEQPDEARLSREELPHRLPSRKSIGKSTTHRKPTMCQYSPPDSTQPKSGPSPPSFPALTHSIANTPMPIRK